MEPGQGSSRAEAVRTVLEAKRAELLRRIDEFGATDPAETSNLNFGKRIGDGTTYAVERMTGRTRRAPCSKPSRRSTRRWSCWSPATTAGAPPAGGRFPKNAWL
jgi:hypothetical protein